VNKIVGICFLLLTFSTMGCALSPELIHELANDDASVCLTTDLRGGTGGLAAGVGGYGQGTTTLCRSKFPNAKLTVSPDGAMSIEHWEPKNEKGNP
jgi:hypothetical protein